MGILDVFFSYFGYKGVITLIGLMVFVISFKYSTEIFDWIERQTYGTRNYLMDKFDRLYYQVDEEVLTYSLLGFTIGIAVFIFGLVSITGHWIIGLFLAVVYAILSWRVPKLVVDVLISRRIKAYGYQMTDALQLVSNGLRSGQTVVQSLAMVCSEMKPPISQEFQMILNENRIGIPLEECFENLSKRIPTQDNDMFVTSINILRETGGNLAEVFDGICDVIRERVRLQQKIDTFVTQGLFQGSIIFAIPSILLGVFYFQDPSTMKLLFTTPIGIVILIIAYSLNFVGGLVMWKIIQIKV